jgi:hypothetical protein
MFLGTCIDKMIPFTPRSKVQNEVFSAGLIFSARPRLRYRKHSCLAYVPRKSGGIALIDGACHLDTGHSTICTSWPTCYSARTLADFKTPACHQCTHNVLCFKALRKFFLCAACLEAWLHVCGCLSLLENAPVTWSTTTAWIP